jgi:hypothetical protein
MRRREFITLFVSASVVSPLAVRAQQPARRIGVLIPFVESDSEARSRIAAFLERLREAGWVESRNIRICRNEPPYARLSYVSHH